MIIFLTPYLYNLHPINQDEYTSPISIEVPQVIIEDTIFVNNDTIISHRSFNHSEQPNIPNQSPNMSDLGTFGDSAGFWNAIFSGLAMVGVVITIFYQLAKDNKDEERARLAQFQEQCLTMLSMLSDIVSQLRVPFPNDDKSSASNITLVSSPWEFRSNNQEDSSQIPVTSDKREAVIGRDCFKYIYDERPYHRNIRDFLADKGGGKADFVLTEDLFQSLRKVTGSYFDHYFRTVYRTLKFIKERDLGNISIKKQEETRGLCADLLRAQLSTYEMAVLYYNALYPKFRNTSKAIFEYFCIFDNLDPKLLITEVERTYYQNVCDTQKNPDDYDSTIHYHCRAFIKLSEDYEPHNGIFSKFFRKLSNALSFRKKYSSENYEHNPIDVDTRKVYNVLSDIAGQPITIRELKNRTLFNEKKLKSILNRLESDGYIGISSRHNGKVYSICKEL